MRGCGCGGVRSVPIDELQGPFNAVLEGRNSQRRAVASSRVMREVANRGVRRRGIGDVQLGQQGPQGR